MPFQIVFMVDFLFFLCFSDERIFVRYYNTTIYPGQFRKARASFLQMKRLIAQPDAPPANCAAKKAAPRAVPSFCIPGRTALRPFLSAQISRRPSLLARHPL